MTTIHANIPSSALPSELSEPSIIRTEYESFTLIPKMGPLSYAYYREKTKRVIIDIAGALDLFKKAKDYKDKHRTAPRLPDVVANLTSNPRLNLINLRRLNTDNFSSFHSPLPAHSNIGAVTPETERDNQLDALVSMISSSNIVISRLAANENILADNELVSERVLSLPDSERLALVLNDLNQAGDQVPSPLKKMATAQVNSILSSRNKHFASIKKIISNHADIRKKLDNAVADYLRRDQVLETIDSLDDSVITDSREWAFLRKEVVELKLNKPRFRGPVSTHAVAPKSQLSLTQTISQTFQQQLTAAQSTENNLVASNLISSQIKRNIGTLFDYGSNLGQTMSEQGYQRDNSTGEKKTAIETTLKELSQANLNQSVSFNSQNQSELREYITEGKDEQFATTEVAFEVYSDVDVTHYLDGIGAVWCPRILNPYRELHESLNAYYFMVKDEYIKENYVVDPAEPIPSYEGIEPKKVNTRKIIDSRIEDNRVYKEVVTIQLSEDERNSGYFLSSNVKCSLKQDDDWTTDALDSDQYRIYDAVIMELVENSHITILTQFKVIDENLINPDSIWLEVSVTKYKYTQSYLEQLKQYNQTVGQANPARREAIKAQAKKYARLKKEELIRKYESNISDLQDHAFVSLMKKVFDSADIDNDWSYYHGILKSCIDWSKVKVEPEPGNYDTASSSGLSAYHFLNVDAVRFFLPIHEGAEKTFFDVVNNTADEQWRDLFQSVGNYIEQQQKLIKLIRERLSADDKEQLTLDQYKSELILGRHLESVLSKHAFVES